MSLLIKGMEMPKSGTYEVSIDNTNGKDKTIMSMFVRGSGGLICCGVYEIVPVPPHGRLIDADALMRHKGDCYDADGHLLYAVGTGNILCAPTIIPASGWQDDE